MTPAPEDLKEPLWVAFPDAHPMSINWRMGAGEDYAMNFWAWWKTSDVALTEESRIAYLRRWPMPPAWTHIAIEMIWPELIDEDSMVFFDDENPAERRKLFDKATAHGFPNEETWLADLNDEKWLG